jgi:hypothetical protein
MAAVTIDSVHNVGPGMVQFDLSDVDDGETLDVDGPVKGFWGIATGNPGTQTSAGVNVVKSVSGSTNTFTFYPGEDNLGVQFTIQR